MRQRQTGPLLAIAITMATIGLSGPGALADECPTGEEVVATVGERRITEAVLRQRERGRLVELRAEEHRIKDQILSEVIEQELLQQEASRRSVTVAKLVELEIHDKIAGPTAEQVKDTYEALQARHPDKTVRELLQLASDSLSRPQQIQERRAEFLRDLRARADVQVLLEPPRAEIAAGTAPARGPQDAPVVIVEFSDYQCPYCARALTTLKQLEESYGDRVRIAFRNYPLQSHQRAAKAAEAAACAHDQGKFWEMRDTLFAHQDQLAPEDLVRYASDIGLNVPRFGACLDSGQFEALWQDDRTEALRHGVTGTPTYFINGRLLAGAQPFESFAELIEDELRRAEASRSEREEESASTADGGAPVLESGNGSS